MNVITGWFKERVPLDPDTLTEPSRRERVKP